jgi:methionyl-tRNA formyltransferase
LIGRHDVVIVYTQPPRRTGRGRKLMPSPVEVLARAHSISVKSPTTLRGETAALTDCALDALVVAAYGLILPKAVLAIPRHGCINVHASLLPRWRGAAPVERAMMAGDRVTGISIMRMDQGLDTGPVLRQVELAIHNEDTGDTLRDRLANLGMATLTSCLEELKTLNPIAQPSAGVTYAAKLTREESIVDWANAAPQLALRIRALNSRQPAYCFVRGHRMRLLFGEATEHPSEASPGTVVEVDRSGLIVACGAGCLRITRVALSLGSGKPLDIASLLNGHPDLLHTGEILGTSH